MATKQQAWIGERFRGMTEAEERNYVSWLNDLHWNHGKTRLELAQTAGCNPGAITALFERNGFRMRRGSQAHLTTISRLRRAEAQEQVAAGA